MKKGLFKIAAVAFLLTACTESNVAGGSSGDAGIYAVKDLDVAGVSQKGPFVTGSAVTVHGIDCKTLKISDEHFEGEVKSDKGDFIVEDVSLKSSCAVFEVSGKYRSEFSGKETDGTLTLRALTDLENREKVNVNILTNLEYERVMYLVTQKGKSFAEAKKQAEKEVLAAFDIVGSFETFENMNIFESGDGNAALLAVSVMMQGGTDVDALVKRMDNFDDSFAEAGVWSDSSTKTAITEWVSAAAANGQLDSIRKNVEGWGIAAEVPAFEKYVEKFGNGPIMLPTFCKTDSSDVCEYGTLTDERDGKTYKTVKIGDQWWMAENLNYAYLQPTSELDSSSFCYNDSPEYCAKYGRLYLWSAAMDSVGQFSTSGLDCGLGGSCSVRFARGVCPEGWHLPNRDEWFTLSNVVRDAASGKIAGKKLKSMDGWKDGNNGLDSYGFSGLPAGSWTYSDRSSSNEGVYTRYWTSSVYDRFSAYSVGLVDGKDDLDESYAYMSHSGLSVRCIMDGSSGGDDHFDWSVPKEAYLNPDVKYDSIVDERDGQVYKTVKIGSQTWMAENLIYADSVAVPSLKDSSWCYDNKPENCKVAGRYYAWTVAVKSICPNGWHLPDSTEWETLFTEVGGASVASEALKSRKGWLIGGGGMDSYGFSVIPTGNMIDNGNDSYPAGSGVFFWTSSRYMDDWAHDVYMYQSTDVASILSANYGMGCTVRCVKD